MMKISEFKKNIDLHGADLSRWPVETVKPALLLIEQDEAAAKMFAEAGELDDQLRRADMPMFDTKALAARIMAAPRGRHVPQRRIFNPLYVPGMSLMIVVVLGFMLGLQSPGDDLSATLLRADYIDVL